MNGDLAIIDYAKGKDVPEAAMLCTPGAIWDRSRYHDQLTFLTTPTAREALKQDQKAFKEAEKAKKAAAKEKADRKPDKPDKPDTSPEQAA